MLAVTEVVPMTESLTDVERRALRWLRDGDDRAPRLAPALVAALAQKGLALDVETPSGAGTRSVLYALTAQGRAALEEHLEEQRPG
jgi:DNA-binding PadR family transcriptional regulator